MNIRKIGYSLSCVCALIVCLISGVLGSELAQTSQVIPGRDWETVASPESIGFSSARLTAVRAWLQSVDTTGMMVVVGGRALFSYGDLTHLSYLASGRKSILSLLYGKYVANGTIDLNRK